MDSKASALVEWSPFEVSVFLRKTEISNALALEFQNHDLCKDAKRIKASLK
jgi:hypothetical protein